MSSLFTSITEVYYVHATGLKKTSKKEYLRDFFYQILPLSQHKAKSYKNIFVDVMKYFILSHNAI